MTLIAITIFTVLTFRLVNRSYKLGYCRGWDCAAANRKYIAFRDIYGREIKYPDRTRFYNETEND